MHLTWRTGGHSTMLSFVLQYQWPTCNSLKHCVPISSGYLHKLNMGICTKNYHLSSFPSDQSCGTMLMVHHTLQVHSSMAVKSSLLRSAEQGCLEGHLGHHIWACSNHHHCRCVLVMAMLANLPSSVSSVPLRSLARGRTKFSSVHLTAISITAQQGTLRSLRQEDE